MSKERTDRAERDRKETAERAEKDRVKTAKKVQEKAEKAEEDRTKTAKKVQEKAEKVEKDRVESARQSERARLFEEVLNRASAHSKGCCEPCNFHVKTNDGKYQPCRLGHEDSGPDKEICADCTDTRYHPKK
jgi:hypothetical protein